MSKTPRTSITNLPTDYYEVNPGHQDFLETLPPCASQWRAISRQLMTITAFCGAEAENDTPFHWRTSVITSHLHFLLALSYTSSNKA
jgi:hypothetical protein